VEVFHAGIKEAVGKFLTSGGRVLAVTAVRDTLAGAIEQAYKAIARIKFEGMHLRTDIGRKALEIERKTRVTRLAILGSTRGTDMEAII